MIALRKYAFRGQVDGMDYILSAVMSLTAAFSGGQAVASNLVSVVAVTVVALGIGVSFLIRNARQEQGITRFDWLFYTVTTLGSFMFATRFNVIFPPDTFPRELLPSSWLLWMMMLGSFFVWSDRTLLFHAIPSLALFGFVGCYDTYRPVVVFFFIFLVAFATLFARAHARDMRVRAQASGYFAEDPLMQSDPDRQVEHLSSGPWRWAAGAEWALWSAMGIVVLSLIGAPVVQTTVKPISGGLKLNNPVTQRLARAATGSSAANQNQQRIGQGPITLRETPVFQVTSDDLAPYRVDTFDYYTNANTWIKNWDDSGPYFDQKQNELEERTARSTLFRIAQPTDRTYTVQALVATNEIPGRGTSFSVLNPPSLVRNDRGGTPFLPQPMAYGKTRITYLESRAPKRNAMRPKVRGGYISNALNTGSIKTSVYEMAAKVAGKEGSDYEKAERIREYIASTIRYTLKPKPIPESEEAVSYTLFTSKEAYCDIFATAMVQMARSIGIPARYSVGYLPNPRNLGENGSLILLEADRHAWAELFFEGHGWMVFDATEGSVSIDGSTRPNERPRATPTVPIALYLAAGALVVVAIGAIGYFILSRKPNPEKKLESELERVTLDYTIALERHTGRRRQLGQTVMEYTETSIEKLNGSGAKAKELASRFTYALYSQSGLTTESVDSLRQEVQDFKNVLKEEAKKAKSRKG